MRYFIETDKHKIYEIDRAKFYTDLGKYQFYIDKGPAIFTPASHRTYDFYPIGHKNAISGMRIKKLWNESS